MARVLEHPAVAAVATEAARADLRGVEAAMPMLADLLRCDVALYVPTGDGAVVQAEARPLTVPSLYPEGQLGRRVTRREEPAVLRVLANGRPERKLSRVLVQRSEEHTSEL